MPKKKQYPNYLSQEQKEMVIQEVRYGLLLDDLPDEYDGDVKLPVFDAINQEYETLHREASAHCYFCSDGVDPNKYEINSDTYMCFECQLKLANFMTAVGIDPGSVLKLLEGRGPRKVQRTRFKVTMLK